MSLNVKYKGSSLIQRKYAHTQQVYIHVRKDPMRVLREFLAIVIVVMTEHISDFVQYRNL